MLHAVFDTCIVMDYAAGHDKARKILRDVKTRILCVVSYHEIMTSLPEDRMPPMQDFLERNFDIEPMDKMAIDQAVYLRNHYRMNAPDSMVFGYTRSRGLSLITRNVKSFNPRWMGVMVPYRTSPIDLTAKTRD